MKKKLEADLISIAHRILQLKNKSDINQLYLETQKLYEKLSVLRFVDEHFGDVKPTIGIFEIERKIEEAFDKKNSIQPETGIVNDEIAAEEIIQTPLEHPFETPALFQPTTIIITEEINPEQEFIAEEEIAVEQEIEAAEETEEINPEQEFVAQEEITFEQEITDPELAEFIHTLKLSEEQIQAPEEIAVEQEMADPELVEFIHTLKLSEEEEIEASEETEEIYPEQEFAAEEEIAVEQEMTDPELAEFIHTLKLSEEEEIEASEETEEINPEQEFATEEEIAVEQEMTDPELTEFIHALKLSEEEEIEATEETEEINPEQEFVAQQGIEAPKKIEAIQISFADFLDMNYTEPQFVEVNLLESIPTSIPTDLEEMEPVVIEEIIPEPIVEPKIVSLNDKLSKGLNIDLNDRIAFIKQLFGNSSEEYNRVINQLITFDTFYETRDFIQQMVKPDYNNWEGKEDYEERFMDIIEKKFL